MLVDQVVHQVRSGRGHQDPKTEQHTKGNQTVGTSDVLGRSIAHWRFITHLGFPTMPSSTGTASCVRPNAAHDAYSPLLLSATAVAVTSSLQV
jgi:hypothetical protein